MRPIVESLETRLSPSITIQFDYSYDTNGFFVGHPDRQSLLATAANALASGIVDNLAAIVPNIGAGDTWTAAFTNPGTGNSTQINNLTVPANTIIIFAGGFALGGAIGEGGPGGFSASGDQAWLNTLQGRGKPGTLGPANLQTAFAPWGGSVEFDTSLSGWYFGANATGIQPNQTDFLSVAEHEIGHVLGFGTSNSWTNKVLGSTFIGVNAELEHGGPVPTDAAGSAAQHWADGTTDKGKHCTMDPVFNSGERDTFTPLDFAGLEDLGWTIFLFSSQPQPVGPGPYASIVGVNSLGRWWVGMSTGSGFVNQLMVTWNTGVTWVDVVTGDFNGDGKTDIAARVQQTGYWWVGINTGSAFALSRWGQWSTAVNWVDVKVGDFTGDKKDDIAGRVQPTGKWWVAVSNGSTAFTSSPWGTAWSTAVTWVDVKVGDFNGDGKTDILGRVQLTGRWWTGLSSSNSFNFTVWDQWPNTITWNNVIVGDFNGDGKDDIAARTPWGDWWVAVGTGSSFAHAYWGTWSSAVSWSNVFEGQLN